MPETPEQKANNERIRLHNENDRREAVKKHGKIMDGVARGDYKLGKKNTGCSWMIVLLTGVSVASFAAGNLFRFLI